MAGKSEEFNNTIQTIEKVGTGGDIVGPENAHLTEQVQSTTTKEGDGKETSLKVDGSSGGGSGGGSGMNEEMKEFNEERNELKKESKIAKKTGETDISGILGKQASGDKLNISAPKKEIKTTTITPQRKSKNTVMIVVNKNNQSSSGGSVKSSGGTQIIVKEKNSLKDQFALSLY